jgi:P27 family predicted phage terminase small subunit
MGTKPRPAGLKILEGRGHGRDSGGRPVKEPPGFARVAPTKPDDLPPDASALWDRIIAAYASMGLLKEVDGAALEVTCVTFARWRDAYRQRLENGATVMTPTGEKRAPWVLTEEAASKEFRAWAAEFALTPSAEARLAPTPAADDENESLFGFGAG